MFLQYDSFHYPAKNSAWGFEFHDIPHDGAGGTSFEEVIVMKTSKQTARH